VNPVRASMTYVYVLRNPENGRLYTGCASDLRKRLSQHQSGKSTYTKFRGPYELIYYEACMNSNDAFAREKYLKTGTGKRYLKNRNKRFLALTG
jgi:putative endonuclease